jgi:tetratricopeptide (TPR) repeat protein
VAAGRDPHRGATAPPLIGRDEITRELRRLLEQAAEHRGSGILLTGGAGIGKSQMLRWLAARAHSRGFSVLVGRALPEELPAPFSLVRDLLASAPSALDAADAVPSDEVVPLFLAPYGEGNGGTERDAEALPAPGTEVGEWPVAPVLAEPGEGGPASRDELFARITEYLLGLARARPLLIVVDDLQFADDSSLEFWRRFAPELAHEAIGFLATVAAAADRPARTREALDALARQSTVHSIPLRPMTAPEVGEFARWISGGEEPPRADVLRWHAQTEGNPLFVEQLVRASIGGARPAPFRDDAPGRDVTEVLIARTRSLGDAEGRLLTYAAILGKEFDFAELAAIAGQTEERVTESLDRLVQDGLVRERGGEVYEFVTEAVRLHVYGELTETRRRLLHRKAGRALEAAGGASDSELARQFYLGRDDAKAVEYNDRAAQAAVRAFAYETAVAHLARALEAQRRAGPSDAREELRFLVQEGRLLEELGNLPRSEEVLLEAVELARSRPGLDLELGRALLGLAQTRTDRAEYTSAELLAVEAAQVLGRVGTPRDVMGAHRVRGTIAWRTGNSSEAERHQRKALAIAETEGTALDQGQALVDLANTMAPLGSGPFDAALSLYTRAADLFAGIEYHAAQARVLMNRAVSEYEANRLDAAFADLQKAIAAAERSRSPIWIGYCHLNLAQWNAELGRPGPARAALDRAAQVVLPIGDRLATQQVAMTRGMVAEAEKQYDAAETHYQDALAQARTIGLSVEVSEMLFRLAHLAFARGDAGSARVRLGESLAAGLREHRPDLSGRVSELERVLGRSDLSP